MALNALQAGKTGSKCTPVTLIKGDGGTYAVCMSVDRYYGGVDLSPLSWSVTVENAAGATDEYKLTAKINEKTIETEWIPEGTATAAVGITKFKLSGFGEDGKTLVWQSGTYHIRIDDTINYVPGSETETALTEVQKLIIYVDGELNRVIKAADAAEAAAEAANRAADRAEGIADGTRIAALEKFTIDPETYSLAGDLVQLDNYSGMPMNCVTHIEPVQAGSGDPSPDNVRPITGFSGAKLIKHGKNIANIHSFYGIGSNNKVEISGNAVHVYTATAGTYAGANTSRFMLKGGVNYTISAECTEYVSGTARIGLRRADTNAFVSGSSIHFEKAETQKSTFSVAEDLEVYMSALVTWSTSMTGDATFKNIQLEIGSAVTAYEPYQGETFSADFGQTVYGGTLDWNTGVLTVTHAYKKLSTVPSSLGITLRTDTLRFLVNGFGEYETGDTSRLDSKCNQLTYKSVNSADVVGFQVTEKSNGNIIVSMPISAVGTTASGINAWLANHPLEFAIVVPNPTTIQLTPVQLTALQGMNNIWCDAGETTVSGRKNILWLTDYLIDRIKALEMAVISTGGNV